MKMDNMEKRVQNVSEKADESHLSPLELIKIHGGKAHKTGDNINRNADSMIAVYKDRFTYTFVMNKEVASIHYDNKKQEIFFSGHNIRNLALNREQRRELINIINVLENDPEGKSFIEPYHATLSRRLTDNK